MSYRAFKKLLGETSLERKWRFVMGTVSLVLITGSFWFYAWKTEQIAYNTASRSGPLLIGRTLDSLHDDGTEARDALNQFQLAGMASDPDQDAKMRIPAVLKLNRHMQKFGVQLDKKQIANLQAAANQAPEGSPLRTELNVTVSMIARTTGAKTGSDLFKFRLDEPPQKKEKKDKGE